jgi:hypothetical protein
MVTINQTSWFKVLCQMWLLILQVCILVGIVFYSSRWMIIHISCPLLVMFHLVLVFNPLLFDHYTNKASCDTRVASMVPWFLGLHTKIVFCYLIFIGQIG